MGCEQLFKLVDHKHPDPRFRSFGKVLEELDQTMRGGRAGSERSLGTSAPSSHGLVEFLEHLSKRPETGVRVLVVDQFEELFTAHLDQWQLRTGLFDELRDALNADPSLRLVLAIREDFV